ncbi:hypothetical protein FF1_016004 [Malus domestica]|uniref:uncharacterized protein LOC126599197 n=1 Tax=Malus sylvestris TaxID=3752 RepID=UPI0021ABA714|nr:uncharacterized protein LOC126599197 [Malus sylvestris]
MGGEEPAGSTPNADTKFLWKALWRAKVPGKVKICVCRGCMNALPSKVNLKIRRVLPEDICGFFHKEAETVEHALLQCPRSAAIWFGSPLGIRTFQRVDEGFSGWLINMAKQVTLESFELLLVLVWSVWKVHNDVLWTGVDFSPLDVQLKAQTWLSEFKKWNVAPMPAESVRDLKWKHPDFGWIKCNFDAAWEENGECGGFGVVVRNATWGFMAALAGREYGIGLAMHAEAVAARTAALFLQQWRTAQVQLEGDVLLVVTAIQNAGSALNGHLGNLFADTRRILQQFEHWKVSFGPRESNKVAHCLARWSLTLDHPLSWSEEPPDIVNDLLIEDNLHI